MHPLVRKLSIFASFTQEEESAIALAFSQVVDVPAQHVLAREEDAPVNIFLLLKGFAVRHKLLPSGGRQILSFMIPGDTCDVGITVLERRDYSTVTMTPSRVARISGTAIEHLMSQYPKIRAALQWATLVEEAIGREWLLNVGQRPAIGRAAHILCEVYYRLHAIGLAERLNYELPLTQRDLADAMGISAVHANRTLQELRHRELIAFGDKRVTILNLAELERRAEFEPTYLHLGARYDERQQAQ